jgi:hypothetical protein
MDTEQIDRRLLLQRAAAAGVLALTGFAAPAHCQTRPNAREVKGMSTLKSPSINLYSRDLARAVTFYADLGFVETFRTPTSGPR